jgi:dihydroorotase
VSSPEKIVGSFFLAGLFETEHGCPLRVHAAEQMPHHPIFAGGIRPHFYCLPILKREIHRRALLQAVASGNGKFFLGTDSAPHARTSKEADCGCAGCYTAFAALELYAEAFDSVGALDRLEAFASFNGADFYGLPRNTGRVTLERVVGPVPEEFIYADGDRLVPLRAGQMLPWRLCA